MVRGKAKERGGVVIRDAGVIFLRGLGPQAINRMKTPH